MHGFIYKPTEEGEWVLGQGVASKRFGAVALNPSGDWRPYVPTSEKQSNRNFESMACTVYHSLNAWETLANFYGFADFPKNCSERFSAILAKITPEGADPHTSCEAVRRWGVIPDTVLPFTEDIRTWDYYYSPNPMEEAYIALGQQLLKKFVLGHEYVFNAPITLPSERQRRLKEALSRGTVCVSVDAWKKDGSLYVKKPTDPDTHWTHLVGYVEGKHWIVRDSYEPFEKKLAWDYAFQTAKLYFLKRNESGATPNDLDFFARAVAILKAAFEKLWRG